jgi:hypothetical protein
MLMLKSKSKLTTVAAKLKDWVEDRVLGSLSRTASMAADGDMCLLLRIEVPRSAYPAVPNGLSLT